MNITLKTEKQEMNYMNHSYALWDCFEFHIAQFGNMLNQAMLPDWAIGPDWLWNVLLRLRGHNWVHFAHRL